jgi:hypothetical protein
MAESIFGTDPHYGKLSGVCSSPKRPQSSTAVEQNMSDLPDITSHCSGFISPRYLAAPVLPRKTSGGVALPLSSLGSLPTNG